MKYLIISLIISMLAFSNISYTDPLSDAKNKLQAISDKVSAIERNIAKNVHNRDKLRSEINNLDGQIGQLHRDIHKLESQVESTELRSQQLRQRNKRLHSELNSHGEAFKQQARVAYLAQRQNKWQLILSQSSLQDASRMAVMYDYVNQARIQQIQQLSDLASEVAQTQLQLRKEQKQLERLIQQQSAHQEVLQQARVQKEQAQLSVVKLIEQGQGELQQE